LGQDQQVGEADGAVLVGVALLEGHAALAVVLGQDQEVGEVLLPVVVEVGRQAASWAHVHVAQAQHRRLPVEVDGLQAVVVGVVGQAAVGVAAGGDRTALVLDERQDDGGGLAGG